MKKILLIIFLGVQMVYAQQDVTYQTPPKEIADLINAQASPIFSLNPTKTWFVLLERNGYLSIEALSQPELRLAGLRINPAINGKSRVAGFANQMTFKTLDASKTVKATGLPNGGFVQSYAWSPDGKNVAFTHVNTSGVSLWYVQVETGQAKQLTEYTLNDVMSGNPFVWLSDSKTLIIKTIPTDRGDAPLGNVTPSGPTVQESMGKKGTIRTYQDLLKNKQDEKQFDYYCTAQLKAIQLDGKTTNIGKSDVITNFSPSPDGKYLMVSTLQKPYSYLVPLNSFATKHQIWDMNGQMIREIASLPLSEDLPKGFDATRKGARSLNWRADKPATLAWVEAQDEGDPSKKVEIRDKMFYLEAPFVGDKKESVAFNLRFQGLAWGNDQITIAYEYRWADRKVIVSTFNLNNPSSKKLLFELNSEDRYNDPGDFITETNTFGRNVLLINGNLLYLEGSGASSEGDKPFLDEIDLNTKKKKRLWQSAAPYFESPLAILNLKKNEAVIMRESKTENPNYFIKNWKTGKLTTLTQFPHPYPQLVGVEKQVIQYKRKDGIALQGNLYVPKGWKKENGTLPVLVWAYPDEFKSKDAAGQVQGSPYSFTRLSWGTPIYWVTQGYAVLDNASMPIIGEGDKEPNDNFIPQLVANAEAAILKLTEMGVGDPQRMAVGGHSYGAFMTANLLAHSDLFAAGIARSGAYNRTLTPFGFQSEERTYWDAPKVYQQMSPFDFAYQVNEPILMIHGEADNNSGTFPIQSERFYAALKGLGKTARYVTLPHESHGYQAKESILHMAWEMNQWLDKYVKNKSANLKSNSKKVGSDK